MEIKRIIITRSLNKLRNYITMENHEKQLVLFNCECFDALINCGVNIQKQYGIMELCHTQWYSKSDPFIIAKNAIQGYYVLYP